MEPEKLNLIFLRPIRPLLRYHGGKWRLASWVIGHFPPHEIYVEPFGGAASVFLQKPRVKTEVWNDLDADLFDLFSLLRDQKSATALIRACSLTLFPRSEFDLTYEPSTDPVERSRRFIVRSFMGFGSKACLKNSVKNGFRCLRTGEASPAVDWSRYPKALKAVVQRFGGVVIENRPALDLIRRFDRKETLFYIDPPYVHKTRNLKHGCYSHEMNDRDHEDLAKALMDIKGMAVVSGDPSALYERLYAGWRHLQKTAYADKAAPRTECLWFSPNTPDARPGPLFVGIEDHFASPNNI